MAKLKTAFEEMFCRQNVEKWTAGDQTGNHHSVRYAVEIFKAQS